MYLGNVLHTNKIIIPIESEFKKEDNSMDEILKWLTEGNITLKEIEKELEYRDNIGVDDDERHVGWNDMLYFYSANEIMSAMETFEKNVAYQ
jgi:hypothetical protein